MSRFFMMRTTPWLLLAAAFASSSPAQVTQGRNNGETIAPQQVVDEATSTVHSAKQDPGLDALIQRSKAVFIVPRFGESAAAVAKEAANASPSAGTGQSAAALTRYGSPGVLLAHGTRSWSSPAFFSVAGVSNNTANQDTSGRGTPVIALFMTTSAAHKMETNGTFSLSGLKVAQYSAQPTTPLENADIVVWSPGHVATSVGVESSRIHFDTTGSTAFYMNQATLGEILSDNVSTGRAVGLQNALASRVASK
jgi:hypothetical protein